MPRGVTALSRLGIIATVGAAGELGRPFVGIRFRDGDLVAEGDFPCGRGLAVRRTRLHRRLVRRATELDVDIRWGERVESLTDDGVETGSGEVTGRWTVGADGLLSRVRRWVELEGPKSSRRRFGVRRHFRTAPWTRRVEVSWTDGVEAYVTPIAEREIGVAFLWSGEKTDFDGLLPRFPRLAACLENAEVLSRDRGAGPFEQRVREVVCGRVLLVGDAAGYVDPVTGEGVGLALQQAEALASALAEGDPERYRRDHRRLVRDPDLLTRLLLVLERRQRLRRRVFGALRRDEQLFSALLAPHTEGDASLQGLSSTLWRLAVGLLRGELRGG